MPSQAQESQMLQQPLHSCVCQSQRDILVQCDCGRTLLCSLQSLHASQDSSLQSQTPDAKLQNLKPLSLSKETPGQVSGIFEPTLRSPTWEGPASSLASQHCQRQERCKPVSELSNTYAWLGMLVNVVDKVAGDYVFGLPGTEGRPKVYPDISLIHSLDKCNLLPQACHVRWLKFLYIWEQAGWAWPRLDLLADDLRPLQYGSGLRREDVHDVSTHLLSQCIAEFCEKQGWDESMQDELKDFMSVVQQHFSHPDAVLLPTKDVEQHWHKLLG